MVRNYVAFIRFNTPFGASLNFSSQSNSAFSKTIGSWITHQWEVVYRYRSIIESGFRLDSLIMPKTGAHTPSLRFFVYGLGLVIFNIFIAYYLIRSLLGQSHLLSIKAFTYILAYKLFNRYIKPFKDKTSINPRYSKLGHQRPPPIF